LASLGPRRVVQREKGTFALRPHPRVRVPLDAVERARLPYRERSATAFPFAPAAFHFTTAVPVVEPGARVHGHRIGWLAGSQFAASPRSRVRCVFSLSSLSCWPHPSRLNRSYFNSNNCPPGLHDARRSVEFKLGTIDRVRMAQAQIGMFRSRRRSGSAGYRSRVVGAGACRGIIYVPAVNERVEMDGKRRRSEAGRRGPVGTAARGVKAATSRIMAYLRLALT